MDRWKSRGGKSQRREKNKKEDQRRERVRRKKMRTTVISNDLWLRSTIARRCGAKHISKLKCANHTIVGALLKVGMWQRRPALRREAHVEVKMHNTSAPERFGKSRCRKRRRCGAKHISKWTCGKHTIVAALLEVEALKKFTFRCQVSKTHPCGTTFGSCDVQTEHGVVARSTFRSEHVGSTPLWEHFVKTTPRSHHFWTLRCQKSVRRCGAKRISKQTMCETRRVETTFGSWDVQKGHAVVARSYATLHYTMLPYATPRYTALRYTTRRYTMLHFTTHHTTLHHTTPTPTAETTTTPTHNCNCNCNYNCNCHYTILH